MELYLYDMTSDLFWLYQKDIAREVINGNHQNFANYYEVLTAKYEENLLPFEKWLLLEMDQLRAIHEDLIALDQKLVQE